MRPVQASWNLEGTFLNPGWVGGGKHDGCKDSGKEDESDGRHVGLMLTGSRDVLCTCWGEKKVNGLLNRELQSNETKTQKKIRGD